LQQGGHGSTVVGEFIGSQLPGFAVAVIAPNRVTAGPEKKLVAVFVLTPDHVARQQPVGREHRSGQQRITAARVKDVHPPLGKDDQAPDLKKGRTRSPPPPAAIAGRLLRPRTGPGEQLRGPPRAKKAGF